MADKPTPRPQAPRPQPTHKTNKAEDLAKRVSQAILQEPEAIVVNGHTYHAAPPSLGTLILASKYVATLPQIETKDGDVLRTALAYAKDSGAICRVLAVLILGAKEIHADEEKRAQSVRETRERGLFARWRAKRKEKPSRLDALTRELEENIAPVDAYVAFLKLVRGLDVESFFGLSTFLSGVNAIRATKKVET